MHCKRLSIAVFVVVMVLLVTGCASSPQYAIADREAIESTPPVELPGWPDGVHIVCPRGHWDPQAVCPSGTEWIAYDAAGADALHAYAIAGEANTEIAQLQADQIAALDVEAAAANDTAAELEHELKWADVARFTERIGWVLGLGALLALGL